MSSYNVPNDPASATRRLIQAANAAGYSVRFVDRLPLYRRPNGWPVYGETDFNTRVIVVNTERGSEQTVITLRHEVIHALGEPWVCQSVDELTDGTRCGARDPDWWHGPTLPHGF